MNALSAGFLVVLAPGTGTYDTPRVYEGVDRVPGYPGDTDEETIALDFYVFGDCKDPRTNLIPSVDTAKDLSARLSVTGRKYEVILCCEGPDSESLLALPRTCVEHLGFDVAAIQADYWSIVDDFSKSPWAERFRACLNEHGLLGSERDAAQYLREYKHRNEPDSDSPLEVVYVARIRAERVNDFETPLRRV
jgi:hypothetical protein